MLKLILSLMLFCLVPTVHAADILKEVKAQLVIESVTEGAFVQTRALAQIKKPLVSTGTFLVVRDLGVIWETRQPLAQTMRLTRGEILQTDGKNTLMQLKADKEPVVRVINKVLFSIFSGDIAVLAQWFDHTGKVDKGRWTLNFTPRDANLAKLMKRVDISGSKNVERVSITSSAGDLTVIEFRVLHLSKQLSSDVKKRFE